MFDTKVYERLNRMSSEPGYFCLLRFSSKSSTGCIKETEQILNRSQRREAAQSMTFLLT